MELHDLGPVKLLGTAGTLQIAAPVSCLWCICADVKTSLMELHDLGPVKLFDTAGIDESGLLGEKKRKKSLSALKESDVGVLVVDVSRHQHLQENGQLDRLRVRASWLGSFTQDHL